MAGYSSESAGRSIGGTMVTLKFTDPELKWQIDNISCQTQVSLETEPLTKEPGFILWQKDIPKEYWSLGGQQLIERVQAARAKLGSKAVILGHHYQREDIIQFADLKGDSFKLAQWASQQPQAAYIVFCGVHFMAEAADVLSAPHQKVILPNMSAGCTMADMADPDDVLDCWKQLQEIGLADSTTPVTYMNSTASLKAFCGQNDGIVCTSSNAAAVLKWAFDKRERVLFFPDQHLGRNTGVKMGIPTDQMLVWDPDQPFGGHTPQELAKAKIILWRGWCSVHMRFSVDQVKAAREKYPDVTVLVHPECTLEVVQASDYNGSTEFIARTIAEAPAGSTWAVGTEINLVSRLARENPDKLVFCLDPVVCPCSTMYRIHPAYLCWVLEELVEGRVRNHLVVEPEVAEWAKVALSRMLQVV